MSSNVKKLAVAVVVLAAMGLGVFLFATRPLAAPSAPTGSVTPSVNVAQGQKAYRVDPASSKVSFNLHEVLSGSPFLVVGETNQVSADIAIDFDRPSATKIGTVKINARGFKTDSTRRDGMIGRFILKSEDPAMEYIVFEPKALEGMPKTIEIGAPFFTYKVRGDLTIAGITKEQVFEGSAFLDGTGELRGQAETTVNRADYKLVIPNVPFVANVDEQVNLKIEFVAKPIAE